MIWSVSAFGAVENCGTRRSRCKVSQPGGDYYNTKIAYLGDEYITLAFQRYHQSQISAEQLADYLDTKPKNIARLEEYMSRRVS